MGTTMERMGEEDEGDRRERMSGQKGGGGD